MRAPVLELAGVRVFHGDCIEVMAELDEASIDAIVTDPPYGLGFMGKDWDDLPPGLDFAREAFRVLKPGGHILAFGGTRTWHRLAVAVEDAGFEIRDSIAWLYGSGFPKSMDVSKAVDKLDAADERLQRARTFQAWLSQHMTAKRVNELTDTDMGHHLTTHPTQPSVATADIFDRLRPHLPEVPAEIEALVELRTVESKNYAARPITGQHETPAAAQTWRERYVGDKANEPGERRDIPATEEAAKWQGWGTALKPAFEPIVVGRKPLVGTVAANVVTHGTGALNIDATRIEALTPEEVARSGKSTAGMFGLGSIDWKNEAKPHPGRWPANVMLDESQAAELDAQSGVLTSGANPQRRGGKTDTTILGAYGAQEETTLNRGTDSGGASRFFPTFRYEAKAPAHERPTIDGHAHPTVKPVELMRWLVRLVTPPGGTVLDPFGGSGTTGEACMVEGFSGILIERDDTSLPLIRKRLSKDIQPTMFGDFE